MSAEKFTSYIWSSRLIHDVTPDLSLRLLGRYGLRRYNEAFSERNTDFWTIGPHVDWRVAPKIKIGLSYHYDRGLSEGRNQPQFEDDTSYINHYLSADADVELTERLSLLTVFHFEHNIWTSGLAGDERNGAHENIYQGEVTLAYWLTDSIQAFGGVQRSSRKESFESSSIKNTNVGIGLISAILNRPQIAARDWMDGRGFKVFGTWTPKPRIAFGRTSFGSSRK